MVSYTLFSIFIRLCTAIFLLKRNFKALQLPSSLSVRYRANQATKVLQSLQQQPSASPQILSKHETSSLFQPIFTAKRNSDTLSKQFADNVRPQKQQFCCFPWKCDARFRGTRYARLVFIYREAWATIPRLAPAFEPFFPPVPADPRDYQKLLGNGVRPPWTARRGRLALQAWLRRQLYVYMRPVHDAIPR